jgi:hypothetical protein
VAEKSHLGRDFPAFFRLLKEDGRRRIVSKIFNSEGPGR